MSEDSKGTPPTDAVPAEVAAARSASGVTPEAARLGAMLVEHVRRNRNMIDAWQREYPGIVDPRVNETRAALRRAESELNKLVTGRDRDLEQAWASFNAALPREDCVDTPQQTPETT